MKAFLARRGLLGEAEETKILADVREAIQLAIKEAETHPAKPPVETLFEGVYAEPLWQQREQLQELQRALAGDPRVADPRGARR
jgi:TPP-dependent pyruvate/acetoin dehydrogenase alpha subunit